MGVLRDVLAGIGAAVACWLAVSVAGDLIARAVS